MNPFQNLKEIKSTIVGLALFALSFAWFAVNFKTLNEFKLDDIYIPSGIGAAGILFLLAPDQIIDLAFSWIRSIFKKSSKK